MSEIKVNSIKGVGASAAAITVNNSDGTCIANVTNNLSNRNKVINGAMICSQRATQVTGSTGAGYKTVDRFRISHTSLGTFTIDQDTNAPNGFSNSLKLSCTTADASPAASDQLVIQQRIEAQNLQDLAYGTSAAKKLVLSFYVKSNKTGNASVNVLQSDNSSKMVGFQYTISAANTWERKTISIPADTSGVINNDNGYGLQIEWFLNSGSNFTGGSHQATYTALDNTNRNVSNLGIGGSTSDNFAITGVQLEVDQTGSGVATDFEHRSFGQELELCKRYCQVLSAEGAYTRFALGYAPNSTSTRWFNHLRPEMRSTPSFAHSGNFACQPGSSFSISEVSLESASSSPQMAILLTDGNSSLSAGQAVSLQANGDATAKITFSSEL